MFVVILSPASLTGTNRWRYTGPRRCSSQPCSGEAPMCRSVLPPVLLLLVGSGPATPGEKNWLEVLQGRWRWLWVGQNGQRVDTSDRLANSLSVKGDKWLFEGVEVAVIAVDTSTDPVS